MTVTIPDWMKNKPKEPVARVYAAPSDASDAELTELLNCIPPGCGYNEWEEALGAFFTATRNAPWAIDAADDWSSKGSNYTGRKHVEAVWRCFKDPSGNTNQLADLARKHGANLGEIARRHRPEDFLPEPTEEDIRISCQILTSGENRKARSKEEAIEEDDDGDENIGGAVDQFDLPDTMLRFPGVVGELVDWICDWTSEPIRLHAVGAALVIVGTLLGRKVFTETRPCCTALYIGATSPSGLGKQHAQDAIRLALNEVPGAYNMHMGWNVSLPAISIALNQNASKVMIADEFADKLIGIRNRNASTSQSAISEGLRSLWGTNTGVYAPDVSISRGDIKIYRPNLSFFGAATHKDFARALVSKDVTNGLFNRFLLLPRYGPVEIRQEPQGIMTLPDRLKERLGWLYNCLRDPDHVTLGMRGDGFPPNPVLVPFSLEAAAMDSSNKLHQKAMMSASDQDDSLALYGRYAEQIKRIALIIACGRRPERLTDVKIESGDMELAKQLVDFSVNQFVLTVRRDMVENIVEANRAKVLGVIRARKEISRSELLRRVRSIGGRDMRDILNLLQDANCIVEFKRKTSTNTAICYRYIRG